jgi:transcriptional regulator with XRE-family HTH domain
MFNIRLRELRKEKGLTQKQIADYLGISDKGYGYYELGQREPCISIIIALCDFYDVSADYLIGRTDSY